MRRIIACALVGLVLAGCVTVRDRNFTYRDPVQIDTTKLRLDGYYMSPYVLPYLGDLSARLLMLWEDGTAVDLQSRKRGKDLVGFEQNVGKIDRSRDNMSEWGAFRIEGDTISMQIVQRFTSGSPWKVYDTIEYRGVIKNDTTFVIKEAFTPGEGWRDMNDRTYHFRPLDNKPDSDNWLKEDERFQ